MVQWRPGRAASLWSVRIYRAQPGRSLAEEPSAPEARVSNAELSARVHDSWKHRVTKSRRGSRSRARSSRNDPGVQRAFADLERLVSHRLADRPADGAFAFVGVGFEALKRDGKLADNVESSERCEVVHVGRQALNRLRGKKEDLNRDEVDSRSQHHISYPLCQVYAIRSRTIRRTGRSYRPVGEFAEAVRCLALVRNCKVRPTEIQGVVALRPYQHRP